MRPKIWERIISALRKVLFWVLVVAVTVAAYFAAEAVLDPSGDAALRQRLLKS
jgi:hypothetical protein